MTQALWRDATQWDSEPAYAQRDRGDLVPLLIMVLVTALFFMSDHTLTAPQMAVENSTMAFTLDALQGISEGSIWRRVAFFGFGIFGVAAIAWRPRWHVRIKGALAWSVLLYLGWACLSLAWTDDPALTVRRLAVLALISVGVAGLLHQLNRQGIVALITFSSLSYLVIGFVNELAKGTFVPLASGYLSGKYKPGAQFTPSDVRSTQDRQKVDEKLREVQRIARDEVPPGVDMAKWALAWCLRHEAVTSVIPGCKDLKQVEANAAAAELVASDHPQAA